ncbi:bifunctional 2-polyprenyl-6-hydroxyphenol methylase/3-demethylubiquinol 3-O-methyltransferase UbiG [Frankia sp. QA3]|uniref:class I SAM-dependent methyltransferase n=1 Tax=Frankia sp. QA3 TaxID=710111 RepID=UPI000269BBB5|nr:class I SAM-dependent methyltransferase [Frankia sp. QA3]EIV91730.1 methyltransferase family protein [Frankia sp. QA3]
MRYSWDVDAPEHVDPSVTTRWESLTAGGSGRRYAERFAQLAAAGIDVHGEAAFCHALVPAGSRILDAGCGTGRVAIRLAELGHRCVGVDVDASMLGVARDRSAAVRWVLADLAALDAPVAFGSPERAGIPPATDGPFDLIVAAGNVIALLAPGTEAAVLHGLARRLAPGGLLVAGFGLDAAHLPLPAAPFGLRDYDGWCAAAGLTLDRRCATWQGTPFGPRETGNDHPDHPDRDDYDDRDDRDDGPGDTPGYAVSVHRA